MFSLNNLQITASLQLAFVALTLFASGVVVLHHTAIPLPAYGGMAIAGAITTTHFILKHALTVLPTSVRRCDASENALFLTLNNGARIKAIAGAGSFLTSKTLLLAWKPFRPSNRWRRLLIPSNFVIITADNVSSPEDFRRLRVLLKFGKLHQPGATTDIPLP